MSEQNKIHVVAKGGGVGGSWCQKSNLANFLAISDHFGIKMFPRNFFGHFPPPQGGREIKTLPEAQGTQGIEYYYLDLSKLFSVFFALCQKKQASALN